MKKSCRFAFLALIIALPGFSACHLLSDLPYKSTFEAIATREDLRVGVDEIYPYFDYENAEVRLRAALALVRLRNEKAVDFIIRHLDKESDRRVSRMLLFALGQIGNPEAGATLTKFFASSVDDVRAAAVEAAGKLSDQALAGPIIEMLENDRSPLVKAEACLALFKLGAKRYGPKSGLPSEIAALRNDALERALLEDPESGVRWRAAYALSEISEPVSSDALRNALDTDENMWTRCFAARGLQAMPATPQIRKALIRACNEANDAGEWNVVVEAIKGLGNYADSEQGLETAAFLINYLLPGKTFNFHIRAAAARTLGRFESGGDTIVKALVRATNDPSRTVVGEAIVALGALGDPQRYLEKTAQSPDRVIRLKTLEGARLMGIDGLDLLFDFAEDESIRVRCASLEALKDPVYSEFSEDIVPLAEEAVQLNDMSLRYTAAELLLELWSTRSIPKLRAAYHQSFKPEMEEARLKIVESVSAIGGPEDEEFFKAAIEDPYYKVRVQASDALASISGELIEIEPKSIQRRIVPEVGEDYKDGRSNPVARFDTSKGSFWIELFKEDAPAHVKNFIDLAKSGVYYKLSFHRVVSNFVVQGLDPRGDGWGYNNIVLRDEINQRRFLSGYVGMPNSGPDSGGCQVFITHCPTPHLDGEFTLFGRVIYGQEVVDSLEIGDRVDRIKIG